MPRFVPYSYDQTKLIPIDCLNMGGFKPPASAGSFQPLGLAYGV